MFGMLFSLSVLAQPKLLDQVVAVVDEDIILTSDVELQYQRMVEQSQGLVVDKCDILNQMITQKLLIAQGKKDSVIVDPARVDQELDRRMRYFISLLGSEELFEAYYGRSVEDYKEEFREEVEKQMMAQDVQSKIVGDVKVSPKEVRAYFDDIPKDSLPYINAEVEFEQIFVKATVSKEQDDVAKVRLGLLREKIMADTSTFSINAELKSDDPGSAANGGRLGCFGRGRMVPEFERVAYTLKPGDISEVFKSDFGYHIMRVYNRVGEEVCAQHILFQVAASNADLERSSKKVDSVRAQIIAGVIDFEKAAAKFSDAEGTDIVNFQTGGSVFDMSSLGQSDPSLISVANDLKIGEISGPKPYRNPVNGDMGFRIIRLKNQTKPHVLSMEEDYAKIKNATTESKKVDLFENWLDENRNNSYIHIDASFDYCIKLKELWLKK